MKFTMLTVSDMVLSTFSVFITILLAYYLRNIWSLVWGYLISACLQFALSLLLFSRPRMRPAWRSDHVALIITRGKWIVCHSALTALTTMSDRLLLGVLIPASQFGFYHISRQIVDLPSTLIGRMHSQMGLQIFSELHKDADSFKARYYRYRMLIDAFSMFSCGFIIVFAPLLVHVMYDERYAAVAPMIQTLAIGLPLIGFTTLREAFSAQRRFREMTMLSLLQTLAMWIGLIVVLMASGSVTGALLVVALHRLPEIAVLLAMGRREGWVDLGREVRLAPMIVAGAGVGWALSSVLGVYVG